MSEATPEPKRFGLITAVYNVARYLPDFISSIESQTRSLDDVIVIAVDDGSTDNSLELLEQWGRSRPDLVTVISQQNGGQASARNAGLELLATKKIACEWVSFPDPDDGLDKNYLAQVERATESAPELVLVATNRLVWDETTDAIVDEHALRGLFAHGDEVKNLDGFPEYFHGAANAGFFRSSIIAEGRLRFDTRVWPNFEDGHFCQRYLLATARPLVAFWQSARYLYRRRADQSSSMQTAKLLPSRFLDVPRYGFLELLREARRQRDGQAPQWLQNMIIYELSYYISPEDEGWSSATACHGDVAESFIGLMRQIRRELDEDVIRAFDTRRLRPHWRQVLLYGFSESAWFSPYVVMHEYDATKRQLLVSYRFTGKDPGFRPYLRGEEVEPVATKIRTYRYFDHALLHERVAWIPAQGTVKARLAGRFVEMRTTWRDYVPTYRRPSVFKAQLGVPRRRDGLTPDRATREASDLRKRVTLGAARIPPARERFANAWVVMDRVDGADDSGERLFEYLREHRTDINAWFVIDEQSSDYARLRKNSDRIIAYGSRRWKLLLLNAKHLVSTHIDVPVHRPREIMDLRPKPRWKFTFLQHGVIRDDISGWLNKKELDLFITSSPAEHESIVADGSNYRFTEKEVKRTGLARFDRLVAVAGRVPAERQDLILVVPTWRNWLSPALARGEFRRRVVADFAETEYARNWLGLLKSDELAELCRAEGLTVGFLPHPNIQPVLPELALPDHVQALTYVDNDVQELFARAAVMVTDYSSIVFNAAYIDRPVTYFQFDRELVEAGGHLGKKGYFDWEQDGFGPISFTVEDAVRDVATTVRAGRRLAEPYAGRAARTFPERDGHCCERIVAAIEAL